MSRWKLGLFVLLGVGIVVVALLWLGVRQFARDKTPFVTYFDGSVGDLDRGSPVTFRGVRVGTVEAVGIAADRRHVRVDVGVYRDALEDLGVVSDPPPPAEMRFALAMAGLTGEQPLELFFVDAAARPPPPPRIDPPPNYVPSVPPRFISVAEAVARVAEQSSVTLDRVAVVLDRADRQLAAMEAADLPGRAEVALADLAAAAASVRGLADTLGAEDGPLIETVRRFGALAGRLDESAAALTPSLTAALAQAPGLASRLGTAADEADRALREARGLVSDARHRLAALDTAALNERALAAVAQFQGAAETLDRTVDEVGAPLIGTLERVRGAADGLDRAIAGVVEPMGAAVERARAAMTKLDGALGAARGPLVAALRDARAASAGVREAVDAARPAEAGASLRRTLAELGTVTKGLGGASGELGVTLVSLRDTLEAIRRLADLLERNPGALLRGRDWGAR